VLGPLCNPAGATHQALGVADARLAERMIRVLANLGTESAFVYYGEDGLDEVTTTGPTYIYRLKDGEITHAEFTPEDFGVARAHAGEYAGGDAEENAAITRSILAGDQGPKRDIALVNAAPAIVAAGLADGFADAMEIAVASVDGGAAAAVLERSAAASREGRGGS
jgi:anthranilate phosphoribosyltransferase